MIPSTSTPRWVARDSTSAGLCEDTKTPIRWEATTGNEHPANTTVRASTESATPSPPAHEPSPPEPSPPPEGPPGTSLTPTSSVQKAAAGDIRTVRVDASPA